MKKLLLLLLTIFSSTLLSAQNIPSYVPTNGLVGWWPFDGNLQDTSGNQLALSSGSGSTTYQSDRNSNGNRSLYFDGSNYYSMGNNSTLQSSKFTISCWVKFSSSDLNNVETIVGYSPSNWDKGSAWKLMKHPADLNYKKGIRFRMWTSSTGNQDVVIENISIDTSQWYNFIMSFDGKKQILYMDGGNMGDSNSVLSYSGLDQIYVGAGRESRSGTFTDFFKGLIDDLIIWNRALSSQEINKMFNACKDSILSEPTSNTFQTIPGTAHFTTIHSDTSAAFQWQQNIGTGWTNLNDFGIYSGTTTDSLALTGITTSLNGYGYRCIIDASCMDTTDVAFLTVVDNVGIEESAAALTISPNPTSGLIYVDMKANYSVYNSTGQKVAEGKTEGQIDLSILPTGSYQLILITEEAITACTIQKI